MKNKAGVFIGEVENGWWVEIPAEGKRWVYSNSSQALEKVEELVAAVEKVEELVAAVDAE